MRYQKTKNLRGHPGCAVLSGFPRSFFLPRYRGVGRKQIYRRHPHWCGSTDKLAAAVIQPATASPLHFLVLKMQLTGYGVEGSVSGSDVRSRQGKAIPAEDRMGTGAKRVCGVAAIGALLATVMLVAPGPVRVTSMPVNSSYEVETPYLPFNLRSGESSRKVFAHYVPNFPISIDNLSPEIDYYTRQYLAPDGEQGIHSSYGGFVRDRPLPRLPIPSPDWKVIDLGTEIAQAKSVGIDGFAVDVIDLRNTTNFVDTMLHAAHVAGDFTILVTADLSGPLGSLTPDALADEVAPYLTAHSTFRLDDGRPVLSAFYAELQSPAWWSTVLAHLHDRYGLTVAFVPLFLDGTRHLDEFAPLSYGFGVWGGRTPASNSLTNPVRGLPLDLIRRTHAMGKIWMQPIAFQDVRPREGKFEESDNGSTNRLMWELAIQNDAEWAQLITWNDYAESTAMAPSVAHGWRILDMNAYDIFRFKFGYAPPVVRDAVYVSYRAQPWKAEPIRQQTLLMTPGPEQSPPRDEVEVVVFAVEPSTLRATVGDNTEERSVPAGVSIAAFPLASGSISVQLWRNGTLLTSAHSDVDVTPTPYVQDLQYRVTGGLR